MNLPIAGNGATVKTATKRKAINSFVEFWSDTLYIRGKLPTNRKLKRYLKAKTGSKIWGAISASPNDVQFFAHYTDTSLESRRKWLENAFFRSITELALYNPALRLFYLTIWLLSEGVKMIEVKEALEECIGCELSEIIFNAMARQLGTTRVIKLDFGTLGLRPGNIAGANARLRSISEARAVKSDEHKSDYEQDLSVVLWQCSQGVHLDEFRKMLSDKGDLAGEVASLRKMLKEKDSKAIRSVILRILRKTIEDLPDIRQDIRNLEAQGREVPLTDGILSTLEAKPEQYENALDNFLDMITEHGVKIGQLDSRDLELLNDELSRLEYGMTRKEYYGEKENQRKQQLKYLSKRLKARA